MIATVGSVQPDLIVVRGADRLRLALSSLGLASMALGVHRNPPCGELFDRGSVQCRLIVTTPPEPSALDPSRLLVALNHGHGAADELGGLAPGDLLGGHVGVIPDG
jgi:hypothetical protein